MILSIIPLYRVVRQDFLPSGVDEAQFEMSIVAPEGASVGAMDEAMRAIEAELKQVRGIRTVLTTIAGGPFGTTNEAQVFVKIAPHDERIFSLTRLVKGIVTLHPLEAFQGNYSQADVMQQVRGRMRKFPDLRIGVRNLQTFNIGGGNRDIDFAIRGPELDKLAEYAETLRAQSPSIGIVDADTTLKLNKPELRARIDRARAADLGVRTQDVAAALRLMVGGDQEVTRFRDAQIGEDYDVQLRLSENDRQDPDTISRLYVSRANGDMVRLDSVVSLEEGQSPSRVDRMDRQRQANVRAGVAPGFALQDRLEALRTAADRLEHAGRLHHRGQRPRPRARAHLPRIRLGVHAVDRVHVHGARGAVREPAEPVHHPAVAAAVTAVRAAVDLPDRQHAEPVFGARHAGAVRRRREERHPADRSHAQPAAPGHRARRGDLPGEPRSAAPDPDDDAGAGRRHVAARARHRPGRRRTPHHRHRRDRRPDAVAVPDAGRDSGRLLAVRRPGTGAANRSATARPEVAVAAE